MKIHREGFGIIAVAALLCGGVSVVNAYFIYPYSPYLFAGIVLVTVVVLSLVVSFFRVPRRVISPDDQAIYCPADGTVVAVETVEETEFYKDKRIQISIFMSPLNVHCQWYPIRGIVRYYRYHRGRYLVAWHPKSSTKNERTTVVVDHKNGQSILCRQIAGAVARRIKCYARVGEQAIQGDEFGFIKFGSRVDVFLPLDARVHVNIDDKVKGRATVLASFASPQETSDKI